MKFSAIENLLCQRTGIDANILGSKKIEKAIDIRCSIAGVSHADDYFQLLRTSPQEFNEFVELIVVPETWFFRDHQLFDSIANFLFSQRLDRSRANKLRVLSIPCSTGEEPYSLAMTLLNLGLQPNQFQIDAVDISKKSLAKAQIGRYSRNSFRGDNLAERSRYFQLVGQEYQLCEAVKRTVNFSQGNLLDSNLLLDKTYDIIFCRNVLIYFDDAARTTTLKNLNRLLKKDGLLFVAASETGELDKYGFKIIRLPCGFAGRKESSIVDDFSPSDRDKFALKSTLQSSIPPTRQKTKQYNAPDNAPGSALSRFTSSPDRSTVRTATADRTRGDRQETVAERLSNNSLTNNPLTNNSLTNNLEKIRNLADCGNITEAISQCQLYLQTHSTSAEAYLLLGQLYQANRLELRAEECFQKAVYLDPKNFEALLHLILLKEQQGDLSKAAILRQRLQRVQNL
jgi:chemotaxis protein methyltransferase WspC